MSKRIVWAKMEMLVGVEYDDDNDESEVRSNGSDVLESIRVQEGTHAFDSPMVLFQDEAGQPAKNIVISLPERLNTDTLQVENV